MKILKVLLLAAIASFGAITTLEKFLKGIFCK
jgi:hypothetical protein